MPERSGPYGLARLASAANATNESGGEAEIAGGVGVVGGGRDAEFTQRARGGSQRSVAQRRQSWLGNEGSIIKLSRAAALRGCENVVPPKPAVTGGLFEAGIVARNGAVHGLPIRDGICREEAKPQTGSGRGTVSFLSRRKA